MNQLEGTFTIDNALVNGGAFCYFIIGNDYKPFEDKACRHCSLANECIKRTINRKWNKKGDN